MVVPVFIGMVVSGVVCVVWDGDCVRVVASLRLVEIVVDVSKASVGVVRGGAVCVWVAWVMNVVDLLVIGCNVVMATELLLALDIAKAAVAIFWIVVRNFVVVIANAYVVVFPAVVVVAVVEVVPSIPLDRNIDSPDVLADEEITSWCFVGISVEKNNDRHF